MKLYSCTNNECKSNLPGTISENQVCLQIISWSAIDDEGDLISNKEVEIRDKQLVCGRCGSDIERVACDTILDFEILGVEDGVVFGSYRNKVLEFLVLEIFEDEHRERKLVELGLDIRNITFQGNNIDLGLTFTLNTQTGYVNFNFKPHWPKIEKEFIRNSFIDYYNKSIEAKITDVEVVGRYRRFEINIHNKIDDVVLTLYIENEKVVDSEGLRDPNPDEIKKAIHLARNYMGG